MFRLKVVFCFLIVLISILCLNAQTHDWIWAQRAGGTDDDGTRDYAIDAAGNSYVTGFFIGTAVFGATTITGSEYTNCFVAKMDTSGNWLWAKTADDTGNCYGMGIALDANANVYIIGDFDGSATFGTTQITTGGLTDIFVAKLDTNGNWIWARKAGGNFNDYSASIGVDNSGNAYLTGNFDRNATFGSITLTVPTSRDIFVSKLSTDGLWAWAVQAGSVYNQDYAKDIAVSDNGDSYITGYFTGTAAFGDSTITSAGGQDIFVAKLDTAGSWYGAVQAGGTGNDHAEHIAVDIAGNCYITGEYSGTAFFGDVSYNGYGGFVAKLDANANWLWLSQSNGSTMCDVAVDIYQNVYLTGGFFSMAIFGNITIYGAGNSDVFVTMLNSAGNWLWVQQAGGTGEDYGMGMGVDSAANVYLAGHFYYSCAFGSTTLTSAGQKEIFVAKVIGSTTTATDEVQIPAAAFTLAQNYPNPFNTSTRISIFVEDNKTPYTLAIYDLKGRKINTLHNGLLSKGKHTIAFDAEDVLTNRIVTGIYYFRLSNGSSVQTRKMIFMK